jgi:hypothetical protein
MKLAPTNDTAIGMKISDLYNACRFSRSTSSAIARPRPVVTAGATTIQSSVLTRMSWIAGEVNAQV